MCIGKDSGGYVPSVTRSSAVLAGGKAVKMHGVMCRFEGQGELQRCCSAVEMLAKNVALLD